MNNGDSKTALILSGGGARGAYQVGVMCAIGDMLEHGQLPFQVITGVSVGAINAVSLTSGAQDLKKAIRRLSALWGNLRTQNVFETGADKVALRFGHLLSYVLGGAFGVSPPQSLFDNTPLKELIGRETDFAQLKKNLDGPLLDALSITASSYEEGLAVAFYQGSVDAAEWRRSRRVGRKCEIGPDHVLASAALPFIFPAWSVDGTWFGDGALRQIAPLSPAIHLGADKLLVIGARDGKLSGEPVRHEQVPYPSIGQVSGQLMDIVFNDNLEADVERLQRINSTLERMLPERRAQTDLRTLDVLMIKPSQDIREIAGQHAHEMPATVRMLLRSIGALKAPWVLPSYLLFEPGYIRALMDLGRKDAEAQADDIKAFLGL
ncbi:patatin-like phospholipase family protein [Parvularcula sp. IMCC14364]|uniref:patatin-like phospholipase family protein n=1 Tax=Parvularcula sp. IMCC14364 TaxID=3067902 RepID=UPI0027408682|nr:patatin-like phospholipase family protein [Parvularcula sp. IMCC14364]